MKKIICIVAITALAFSGCKKFLDVKSKTDVVENDMFSNEQGFMDAMVGVYFKMTDTKLYGDKLTMSFLDVIARRYNINGYPPNNDYKFIYENPGSYTEIDTKGRIDDIWLEMYNGIANANNILVNIDAKQSVFKENNYKLIKGEALGVRAFMHFDLLRMFGPSYLTGANQTSIPYVTTFNAKLVTPLSTVKQVSDNIIRDLLEASTLLKGDDIKSKSIDNSWLNNRKCHFNYLAAEATLARVYLYTGDKVNALLHAKNVIANTKLRFVTERELQVTNGSVDFTFTPEQIFSLNKNDLLSTGQVTRYFGSPDNTFSLTNSCGKDNNSIESVERIYEVEGGNGSDYRYNYSWTSISGYYYPNKFLQDGAVENHLLPLIRLPEMYYIAAECSTSTDAVNY